MRMESFIIDDVREKIEFSNVEAEKNVSCTLSPILAQAVFTTCFNFVKQVHFRHFGICSLFQPFSSLFPPLHINAGILSCYHIIEPREDSQTPCASYYTVQGGSNADFMLVMVTPSLPFLQSISWLISTTAIAKVA
jgi:hypothetical protein